MSTRKPTAPRTEQHGRHRLQPGRPRQRITPKEAFARNTRRRWCRRLRRIVTFGIAGTAALALAACGSSTWPTSFDQAPVTSTTHARLTPDQLYLGQLRGAGILVDVIGHGQAVDTGHLACEALAAGNSEGYLVAGGVQAVDGTFTPYQIRTVIEAAVAAYCPGQTSQLIGGGW